MRDKAEWDALFDFLQPLDRAAPVDVEKAFSRCLESVARRLAGQSFKYQIPIRVSLADLRSALEAFLGEPSGGLRSLAVTAAMMSVLGQGFSIFARVTAQGLNEAGAAPGIRARERTDVRKSMATAWASGLNVYQMDVVELAAAAGH